MGRKVDFTDGKFILTMTGINALFSFKRKISIPYKMIENVLVEDFQDSFFWMLQIPGVAMAPLNIYEGSFKFDNEWYFLSYEGFGPLVKIELNGHKKYRYLIFRIDFDPTKRAEKTNATNDFQFNLQK